MCEASQADRKSMPRGIWSFQKAIGLPTGTDNCYGASRHTSAGFPRLVAAQLRKYRSRGQPPFGADRVSGIL